MRMEKGSEGPRKEEGEQGKELVATRNSWTGQGSLAAAGWP